jgi:hypothetical protein
VARIEADLHDSCLSIEPGGIGHPATCNPAITRTGLILRPLVARKLRCRRTLNASGTGPDVFPDVESRMQSESLQTLSVTTFCASRNRAGAAAFSLTALQESCGVIKPSDHEYKRTSARVGDCGHPVNRPRTTS